LTKKVGLYKANADDFGNLPVKIAKNLKTFLD
jgi:hypothetical protein